MSSAKAALMVLVALETAGSRDSRRHSHPLQLFQARRAMQRQDSAPANGSCSLLRSIAPRSGSGEQGRMRVSYLEGWQVIAEANRIFGFDGWDRLTLNASCVAEHERPVGRGRKSGWGVTYTARARIVVIAGERSLIREGSGAGHGVDLDQGLAHESALKEAETDATKRALMSFGNAFGLALYDKQQCQVSSGMEQGQSQTQGQGQAPVAIKVPQRQPDPTDASLEPALD